jgi:hypothetical protein
MRVLSDFWVLQKKPNFPRRDAGDTPGAPPPPAVFDPVSKASLLRIAGGTRSGLATGYDCIRSGGWAFFLDKGPPPLV